MEPMFGSRLFCERVGKFWSDRPTAGLPGSYKLGVLYVRWHFCWRGPILNPGPVLDSSAQTTRGNQLDFFCKT